MQSTAASRIRLRFGGLLVVAVGNVREGFIFSGPGEEAVVMGVVLAGSW